MRGSSKCRCRSDHSRSLLPMHASSSIVHCVHWERELRLMSSGGLSANLHAEWCDIRASYGNIPDPMKQASCGPPLLVPSHTPRSLVKLVRRLQERQAQDVLGNYGERCVKRRIIGVPYDRERVDHRRTGRRCRRVQYRRGSCTADRREHRGQ